MCLNETLARYARQHNGANVLALGATLVSKDEAIAIVDTFLDTPMREARYIRRLAKIRGFGTLDSRARLMSVDLERLIQIVVEELAAAAAGRAPVRCSCHSILYECCPSRVAPVVQRAQPGSGSMRSVVALATWHR